MLWSKLSQSLGNVRERATGRKAERGGHAGEAEQSAVAADCRKQR
jgi:hypothetical protein